jgi:formate dehydrogenase subunit delta
MIQRANEIASQFKCFPRAEAIERIRSHIEKFWERPLREQLINYVMHSGEGLDELVIEAVKRLPVDA